MKAELEKDIQASCLELLKLRGILCWRQNQGGAMIGNHFVRFSRGVKGISDIIGILPDGRLLAVEVKRPGKKPDADQQWFLDEINRLGGVGACVHSIAELEAVLTERCR